MPCSDGCYSAPSVREREQEALLQSALCEACQLLEMNNLIFPPRLSVWWFNHKEQDRKRLKREVEEKKKEHDRKEAISKLTPYERKLLGID